MRPALPRATLCCVPLLAGCAAPPPSAPPAPPVSAAPSAAPAPAPSAAPAPAPSAAPSASPPPSDPAAWIPLPATPVPCPDRTDGCVEVRLPARGHLVVQGSSPHHAGCGNFDGGRIEANIDQRVVALRMTWHGLGGTGLCRARAILKGRGVVGPLDPGVWLLWPDGRSANEGSPLSPLHLGQVQLAPVAGP